jgi:hypothetical protein
MNRPATEERKKTKEVLGTWQIIEKQIRELKVLEIEIYCRPKRGELYHFVKNGFR